MSAPREDRGIGGKVLGGVVLVIAAGAAWWMMGDRRADPMDAVAASSGPPARADSPPDVRAMEPSTAMPASAVALPAVVSCPHQHLELLSADGVAQTACVSATLMSQSGSVRTYHVEPEGTSRWSLRVRVVEGRVIGARLSAPLEAAGTAQRNYGCTRDECAAMSLGAPDAQGVRRLASQQLSLRPLAVGGQASAPLAASLEPVSPGAKVGSIRLTATLATQPDRQTAMACPMAGVNVVDSGGSVVDFCPLGGSGFEVADDGRLRYRFDDLEGRHLFIGMATDGSIDTITLGELECAMPACGGVTTSSLEGDAEHPGAQRTFAFSGTTLRASGPSGRSAGLNGSVVMPSQDP